MQHQRAASLVSGCNKSFYQHTAPGFHEFKQFRRIADRNDLHFTLDLALETRFQLSRSVPQRSCNYRHPTGG